MDQEDIRLKISAMHLRLMDYEPQYQTLLSLLLKYSVENSKMGEDVNGALEDGLKNHQRALGIENALSPRFIHIVKREKEQIRAKETEGYYQVVLGLNDGYETAAHFDKKQDQLLYILMVLCSLKNGLLADFFKKKEADVRENVGKLIDLIYPHARENGDFKNIMTNLNPDVYFTDIVQKIKAPIEKVVNEHGAEDELVWFIPYWRNFGLKRVYNMRILPANIEYPKEFQPIVDALPNTAKYVDYGEHPRGELKGFEKVDKIQLHDVLLRQAEEGDLEAMNVLAGNYNYGTGVEVDQKKAFSWWKKAADLGHDESQYFVGLFYGTGDVVSQDYKMAIKYFKMAADQGYVDAIYQLGRFIYRGFGCRKNIKNGLMLMDKAAEAGNKVAMKEVAHAFYRGEGVRHNFKKALKYYFELAKDDDDEAYWHIIQSYLEGKGVEKDEKKAMEWIDKGIEKGMAQIYIIYGLYLCDIGKYDEATIVYRTAAERGAAVNHLLAEMNMKGQGLGSGTKEETIEILTKGVLINERACQEMLSRISPSTLRELEKKRGSLANKLFTLRIVMAQMGNDADRERFLKLVDAYREIYDDKYLVEIIKQLNIHTPSTDRKNGKGLKHRGIVVRKTDKGDAGYEVVLIMANGEEAVVKMNINSLVIYLLAIICSYKSGFTRMMVNEDHIQRFRPYLKELILLVFGEMTDKEIDLFIERFLINSGYFRSYSYGALTGISTCVDIKDEALYYKFDGYKTVGRQNLRRMIMDVKDIELPQELLSLAKAMPDAKEVLQTIDNQDDLKE